MAGGYDTKNNKIFCMCCEKKTDEFDVKHGGAEITIEAMKYPVCSKCLKRRDDQIIKKIKEHRRK